MKDEDHVILLLSTISTVGIFVTSNSMIQGFISTMMAINTLLIALETLKDDRSNSRILNT